MKQVRSSLTKLSLSLSHPPKCFLSHMRRVFANLPPRVSILRNLRQSSSIRPQTPRTAPQSARRPQIELPALPAVHL